MSMLAGLLLAVLLVGCAAGAGASVPGGTPPPEPTTTPEPTPEPTPTAGAPFTRLVIRGVGLGDQFQIAVEVIDRSQNVLRGYPADGNAMADAPWPPGGNDPVAWNPGGDRLKLAVLWVGGVCDVPALFAVSADGRDPTLRAADDGGNCDALGLGRAFVLVLARPIDAASLQLARVDPAAPDGCPTGDEWVAVREMVDSAVMFGTSPRSTGYVGFSGRFGPTGFPDITVGPLTGFDPDEGSLTVGTDAFSVVWIRDPALRPVRLHVTVFTRDDAVAGRDVRVSEQAIEPDRLGRLVVRPPAPGRFVLRLLVRAEHACAEADLVAFVSLDVE